MSRVWIDGGETGCLEASDRGLLYGDGFFTTVRWQAGGLLNWAAHRQRLRRSAETLGFPDTVSDEVEAHLVALMPQWRHDGVVRVTVTRGVGMRGYAPPERPSCRVLVHFSAGVPSRRADGLTVGLSEILWPRQPQLAGIKHLNRLPQVLAAQRLPNGCDEALMQDDRHRLISGISGALVARLGRTLYSPVLEEAGVDSTTVSALRHVARSLGWRWQTIPLPVGRLMQMEGVALLNAVRGLQPVARLRMPLEKRFDSEGWMPLNEALEAWLREEAWRGN